MPFDGPDSWAQSDDERRHDLLKQFKHDRILAHKFLFAHRHKDEDPAFVRHILGLFYSDHPLVAMMAFRGAAKSTYIEEYVLLSVLFREAIFPLIIGPKWESACEHLAPIRNELENNDKLIDLFGDQKASPWSTDELGLANGAKIQAVGAGQSMRGKKHNDDRPDMAAIDDLEDEDSIGTEESRRKTDRWLMGTLIPALHPTQHRVRFIGTAIHPKSLIVKKCNDSDWKSAVFPLVVNDLVTGEEKSTWPSRFPMEWVKRRREEYMKAGNYIEWMQEYQCVSEDIAGKTFQPKMIKVEPVPQSYLPVFTMTDPARTTKEKSARTGYVAFSWMGNRLIVHKAEGHFHKPDEIVRKQLEWNIKFNPVRMGIEAVGLEEFIMQPLRAACLAAGVSLPLIDMRAPKDKISFIKGLQPFYIAGEVIHVEHHPDLEQELIQFSTGRIDVLNALAYAVRMRAGRPVYDDFTARHIAPTLEAKRGGQRFLCVSSRSTITAGVLAQYVDDTLKVYRSWVYNEPPKECFERMLRESIMEAGGEVKVYVPSDQFGEFNNTGLPAALRAARVMPTRTDTTKNSEGSLRQWLTKQTHGGPAFLVKNDAHWVINGLAAGYARRLDKHGHLEAKPADDQYRVTIEALESFVAWWGKAAIMDEGEGFHMARTKGGRPFISLRPDK